MSKKRTYIPKSRHNPEIQARKIEGYKQDLINLQQTLTLITESNEKHYQLLGNFARHDIKNIIINLNSILELHSDQIEESIVNSLQINIDSLSSVTGNFSKLIPHSENSKFKFNDLFIALRILVASNLQKDGIHFEINYDQNNETEINLPFQAVLQMLNNLVVNSTKALEKNKEKKIININSKLENDSIIIEIFDNGSKIASEHVDKIFNFNFSTTGGSGIGLNHAKYLCQKFNGSIKLDQNDINKFCKCFVIEIPLN